MKSFIVNLLLCCFLISQFLSCDKTPIGYSELERDIADATFLELRSNDRYCYGKYIPLGTASNLMLGRNANYESRILMQFALGDSLLDSVQKVKLVVYPSRHKGVHFKIYPLASEWRQAHATWVRMDENVPWDNDGGDYYPTVLAETTLTADSCVIELKRNKLDSLVNHSKGIILIPETDSTNFAMLYASEASSNRPRIIYQYRNKSTIYNEAYYASEDCHIVDTNNLNLGMFDFWVGAGFPYRTLLRFPIKESLPANVTIAYAELLLPVSQQFSMLDTMQVSIFKIIDSLSLSISTKYADYISAKADYILAADTLIVLDVRRIIQFWNKYNGTNNQPDSCFGILLSGYPENYGISRLQFKTTAPGIRLKIGYINPPKGRF